jgi:hypothetical protein
MSLNKRNDSVPDLSSIEAEMLELCKENTPILLAFAINVTESRIIVKEGIEAIFLRFLLLRIRGQQIANPKAWLVRMLKKRIADYDLDANQEGLSLLLWREREYARLQMAGFCRKDIDRIMSIPRLNIASALASALREAEGSGECKPR